MAILNNQRYWKLSFLSQSHSDGQGDHPQPSNVDIANHMVTKIIHHDQVLWQLNLSTAKQPVPSKNTWNSWENNNAAAAQT